MSQRFTTAALLLLLFSVSAFVLHTSAALPPIVASHFAASGAANGFMSRGTYVSIMLLFIVAAPVLIVLFPIAATGSDGKNLNLPHRDYWLAPERRAETIAFLRIHGQWFAAAVSLFLSYVHWLVVRANELRPPRLPSFGMSAGLVVFFLFVMVWLVVLFARFLRRD